MLWTIWLCEFYINMTKSLNAKHSIDIFYSRFSVLSFLVPDYREFCRFWFSCHCFYRSYLHLIEKGLYNATHTQNTTTGLDFSLFLPLPLSLHFEKHTNQYEISREKWIVLFERNETLLATERCFMQRSWLKNMPFFILFGFMCHFTASFHIKFGNPCSTTTVVFVQIYKSFDVFTASETSGGSP